MKILKNKVKCKKCGSVIESTRRHEFIWCECKSIFTDGGTDYIRRGGDHTLMEDMSEYEEDCKHENTINIGDGDQNGVACTDCKKIL